MTGLREFLERMQPYRVGERVVERYTFARLQVRRFSTVEGKDDGRQTGRAFMQPDHEARTMTVVVNSEAVGGCPMAFLLLSWHESGHVIGQDMAPGMSARKFTSDAEQEADAWSYARDRAGRILPPEASACLRCVMTRPVVTGCKHPDLGGMLLTLAKSDDKPLNDLAALVKTRMKTNPDWYDPLKW